MSGGWSDARGEIIAAQERALHAARRAEHERATALILEAIRRWRTDGIDPVPLRARTFPGRGSVRTPLVGWYLKHDRTVGVDTEGRYYVLRAPGGLRSRWRGAHPEATLAPMVVGRGGRDGESFDLPELLQMRSTDPVGSR